MDLLSEYDSYFDKLYASYENLDIDIQDPFSAENNQAYCPDMASSQECIQPTVGPYALHTTSTDVSEFPVHEPGHYESQKSSATTAAEDVLRGPTIAEIQDRGEEPQLEVEAKVRIFLQGASQANDSIKPCLRKTPTPSRKCSPEDDGDDTSRPPKKTTSLQRQQKKLTPRSEKRRRKRTSKVSFLQTHLK